MNIAHLEIEKSLIFFSHSLLHIILICGIWCYVVPQSYSELEHLRYIGFC